MGHILPEGYITTDIPYNIVRYNLWGQIIGISWKNLDEVLQVTLPDYIHSVNEHSEGIGTAGKDSNVHFQHLRTLEVKRISEQRSENGQTESYMNIIPIFISFLFVGDKMTKM